MATARIGNLSIESATYGGKDLTAYLQRKFGNYMSSGGYNSNSWSFKVGIETFGLDPNPNILKVAVITYRYFLEDASINDRAEYYSKYQTVTGRDGDTITMSPAGQTFSKFTLPAPTASNQTIISAYWFDKDVTAAVQGQWSQLTSTPDLVKGTDITVGQDALGPDPLGGNVKQCSIVYGNYVTNRWFINTVVDLRDPYSWTLHIPPASPAIINRRLNIFSAVWGGRDYTAWMRNKYVSDLLGVTQSPGSVIDTTHNVWNFTPTNDFFGPDPLPGTQKVFTMVYRIAAMTGTTTGTLIDPKAPPRWTKEWYDKKPLALNMGNIPVLDDASDFLVATTVEGSSLSIDLAHADMAPLTAITSSGAWIAGGTYHTTNVTEAANNQLAQGHKSFPVAPQSFAMTSDPAPGTKKQFAAAVAYPLVNQNGFEMRTIALLDGATLNIPAVTPALNVQYPLQYQPPTFRKVKFTDRGLANGWPQVYKGETKQWSPRPDWNDIMLGNSGKWVMTPIFESQTVDLIDDAGCKEGDMVRLNFNIQSFDDSPKSDPLLVSANPNTDLEIVYHVDTKEVHFFYCCYEGIKFGLEFVGLCILAAGG